MSYKLKLRAQGDRRVYMKEGSTFDEFFVSLSSGTENKIAIEILRNTTLNGFLRASQDDIVKKLGVSRNTVIKVFKKAKDTGVLLAVGRRWYINPYVVLPYNLADEDCNKLQQMWDSMIRIVTTKGSITMKEALLIHEVLFGPEDSPLNYNRITGELNG